MCTLNDDGADDARGFPNEQRISTDSIILTLLVNTKSQKEIWSWKSNIGMQVYDEFVNLEPELITYSKLGTDDCCDIMTMSFDRLS